MNLTEFFEHFRLRCFFTNKTFKEIKVVSSVQYASILFVDYITDHHFIPDLNELDKIKTQKDGSKLALSFGIYKLNSRSDEEAKKVLDKISVHTG